MFDCGNSSVVMPVALFRTTMRRLHQFPAVPPKQYDSPANRASISRVVPLGTKTLVGVPAKPAKTSEIVVTGSLLVFMPTWYSYPPYEGPVCTAIAVPVATPPKMTAAPRSTTSRLRVSFMKPPVRSEGERSCLYRRSAPQVSHGGRSGGARDRPADGPGPTLGSSADPRPP